MAAVARSGDAYAADNPALPALHGFPAWDRGRIARGAAALQQFDEALAAGEHWFFYRDRARELLRQNRDEDALADADRALALAPDEPSTLVLRIRALARLGRTAEAVPHVQLLNETDPGNRDLTVFQQSALQVALDDGHQLLERDTNASGAIRQFTMAIDVTGGNAEVFYWRGRAYLQSGDHDRALADFEEAIRQDPRDFESYRNIDYVLATRRDWDGVIRHWTQYLALVPTDGRAYFERGGAANHKGDRPAALEDARKACEWGIREACAAAGRAR
jgi:tetratricopeptide (TPR) repeat protein